MVDFTFEGAPPYRIEKPDIQGFLKEGLSVIDMHVHSIASDGADAVRYILEWARARGIGVAITDHNRIAGAVEAFEDNRGVMVIPGIEATSAERRHFLLYFGDARTLREFFTQELKNGRKRLPGTLLADLKHNYDFLISVAHPNGFKRWHNLALDFNILLMDALEILNAKARPKHAQRVYAWASEHMKGLTGGTDAHMAPEVGTIVTCAKASSVESFLDAVRNRETYVVGTFYPSVAKLLDYVRYYPGRRLRSTVVSLLGRRD